MIEKRKSQSLTLFGRFLIPPLIGILLVLILYFYSSSLIQSNTATFKKLNDANLPYITEVSRISVALSENNVKFNSLLLSAINDPDGERIHLNGQEIINQLRGVEDFLKQDLAKNKDVDPQLLNNITESYLSYQQAVTRALEMSTANTSRAGQELVYANQYLIELHGYLLNLAEDYNANLNAVESLVKSSLDDDVKINAIAGLLILIMLLVAVVFARHLTGGLHKINEALLSLAAHKTDVELPHFSDTYLQQLASAVMEFRKTLEEIQQARVVAEASSQVKSDFLSNMSHELRTPLNGVTGMLELLKTTDLSADQKELLAVAESSVQSLLKIIEDILDVSSLERGGISFDMVDFDLGELLEDIVGSYTPKARNKGLYLELSFKSMVGEVNGDIFRVSQVVQQLLENAIEFTEQGGIKVEADCTLLEDGKPLFVCTVTDTGCGIEESKLDMLFEAFTQVDTSSTRQHGGVGVGLKLVHSLSKAMNGGVEVSSVVGEGSRFTVRLQLMPAVDVDEIERLR